MDLSDREREILSTIIEVYIETAAPVGSRTASRSSGVGLSPASIRNVMADLTEKGFLEQPHASAGRVPTPMAFRFYLGSVLQLHPLSDETKEQILMELGKAGPEITDTLRQAGKLLSSLSSQVSMVLAPLQSQVRWKRLEFVSLKPNLVLVVLILQGGLVQQRVLELDEPLTSDDLTKFANYLNDLFANMTVAEVRAKVLHELAGARRELSHYFTQALKMVEETVKGGDRPELFVEGASGLLGQPEFAQMETVRELMGVLEDKEKILVLLDKVMDNEGILITLGDESAISVLNEYGLIASPYAATGQRLGAVGLIGPMRMNYSSLVPVVDFTARAISRILRERF